MLYTLSVRQLKNIGEDLRSKRQALRLTLQDLSKESGVPLNTIARIERGEIDPRISTVSKLLESLQVLWESNPK